MVNVRLIDIPDDPRAEGKENEEYGIVYVDGKQAGEYHLVYHNKTTEIAWLGIFGEFRGTGIGSLAYREIAKKAAAREHKRIYLEPRDSAAEAFWERMNFKLIPDTAIMEKRRPFRRPVNVRSYRRKR